MTAIDRGSEQIYMRQLPGGGFVAILATPVRNLLGRRRYRGDVVVERRIDPARRAGHPAPVVATAHGASLARLLHELFPLAQSNTALATLFVRDRRHQPVAG